MFALPQVYTTTDPGRTPPQDLQDEEHSILVSEAEFAALEASGQLLASWSDLFVHPLVARRHGLGAAQLQEVLASGRLPLLLADAEVV